MRHVIAFDFHGEVQGGGRCRLPGRRPGYDGDQRASGIRDTGFCRAKAPERQTHVQPAGLCHRADGTADPTRLPGSGRGGRAGLRRSPRRSQPGPGLQVIPPHDHHRPYAPPPTAHPSAAGTTRRPGCNPAVPALPVAMKAISSAAHLTSHPRSGRACRRSTPRLLVRPWLCGVLVLSCARAAHSARLRSATRSVAYARACHCREVSQRRHALWRPAVHPVGYACTVRRPAARRPVAGDVRPGRRHPSGKGPAARGPVSRWAAMRAIVRALSSNRCARMPAAWAASTFTA